MNSGEYVLSIQNNQDSDWILRCNYLRSLIAGKQITGLDEKQHMNKYAHKHLQSF